MRSSATGSLSSLPRVELDFNFQSNRRRRVPSTSYYCDSSGGHRYIAVAAITVGTDWVAWQVVG